MPSAAAMNILLPFAKRFVAGTDANEALSAVRQLNQRKVMATLDILGENVTNADQATEAAHAYEALLGQIQREKLACNVSLKLSQFGLYLSEAIAEKNLRRVLTQAKSRENFVRLDMEGSDLTEKTLKLFWSVRNDFNNVGIVLQAYLRRTTQDVAVLIERGGSVRLCKGAYKEPAAIAFQSMPEIRANYLKLAQELIAAVKAGKPVYPAFATHDDLLINELLKLTSEIPKGQFEFQMLYGLRRKLGFHLADQCYQVRSYVPYGSDWFPYFYRRLRERKENVFFILRNLFKD